MGFLDTSINYLTAKILELNPCYSINILNKG
jgi:hypothetical protein